MWENELIGPPSQCCILSMMEVNLLSVTWTSSQTCQSRHAT